MQGWRVVVGLLLVALVNAGGHAAQAASLSDVLLASSADGRFVLLAQAEPSCLVVLDAARLTLVQTIAPAARAGRVAARIAAMRTAPLRRSFIVAPADLPELWEISYDPQAEDIYDGLVHDYRFGEGVPRRAYLAIRRTALPEPLADFALDVHESEAWGLARPAPLGSGEGQVINLDVRRRIAVVPAATVQELLRGQLQDQVRGASGDPARELARELAQRRSESRAWPCAAPKVQRP